jgi:hypothetical protein
MKQYITLLAYLILRLLAWTLAAPQQLSFPRLAAIPADAWCRKYFAEFGWSNFVTDSNNSVKSTLGQPGVCPPPGDSAYFDGTTEGDFCIQLTLEDGSPNDEDFEANGVIKDPGGIATVIPMPNLAVLPSNVESQEMNRSDGEVVVFKFFVESDSTDALLERIELMVSGEIDESDVNLIAVYVDQNNNDLPEASERVSTGEYFAGTALIRLYLDEPYPLAPGETQILVTYTFASP